MLTHIPFPQIELVKYQRIIWLSTYKYDFFIVREISRFPFILNAICVHSSFDMWFYYIVMYLHRLRLFMVNNVGTTGTKFMICFSVVSPNSTDTANNELKVFYYVIYYVVLYFNFGVNLFIILNSFPVYDIIFNF